MALREEQQRELHRQVAAWRANPECKVACPSCGDRLTIVDRSARPYAEWYALACPACGLSETLHVPLGTPIVRLD